MSARASMIQVPKASAGKASNGGKKNAKRIGQISGVLLGQTMMAKLALADAEGLTLTPPSVEIPTSLPSVDGNGLLDIVSDNPILVGGIVALLAVPLGINAILQIGSDGAGLKPTSPEKALEALEGDSRVILIDIRSRAEVKEQGSPDLRAVKRSAVSVPYTSLVKGEFEVDDAFGDKVAKVRGMSEESLVILLDSDGSEAKEAAKQISGVAKIYYVQGGAQAWAAYGAWREPGKGLSLGLPDLKGIGRSLNSLAEDYKEAPSMNKAGIALGALAGASFLLVNEAEVILEAAGLLAAGNFFLRQFLFADKREKAMSEIKEIVDEKVAVKEVASDLNKITEAVLADSENEEIPTEAMSTPTVAEEDKPENVKEAAEWIENWKARSQ